MLTFHRAYPKIHFRIMRTVNPLLQLYINRRFQKYISVSSCHCYRVYFKRSLFILSLLFLKTMNGVISWYVLVLQVKRLSGVSRSVLLQSLVINTTGLVQFGNNLSYIFSPLASQNYFLQNISMKLIYQFLYPNNGYLFFRCLERVFEEERNENKEGNS